MLESFLRQEVEEKGPLSQSRFMELALQHPSYGYYRTQEAVGQDFTTSPEISQIFGELIGAWAIDCYTQLEQPKTINVVELGPGKGTLMADFLKVAKLSESFFQALKIHLVEINPLMREAQQKTINFPATWVERLEDIPVSLDPLILIANEFLDTFPTNYYVRKDNVVYERRVGIQEAKLSFTFVRLYESQGPNQSWEESVQVDSLIDEICARLLNQRGICIDYGYEKGQGESLQALFKGELSDPLFHVGKSDLTCHVNFGKLKETALSKGLGVLGPLPQGRFLKNIGLDVRAEMLKHKNPSQKASLEAAVTRLTHPQQMGTLFKVMAVFSPPTLLPTGFES